MSYRPSAGWTWPGRFGRKARAIARRLAAGESVTAVARRFTVSTRYVSEIRLKARIPSRRGPSRHYPETHRRLRVYLALRQLGHSNARIAWLEGGGPGHLASVLQKPRPRVTGPCAACGGPAAVWHHTSYVPEVTVALCRGCHNRVHKAAEPVVLSCKPR